MNITVYCGASFGNDQAYVDKVKDLANWIADNGYNLVYGGSKVGLMGTLSDSVLEKGSRVIGIMPKFLNNKGIANEKINHLIIVEDMPERKKAMAERGDAFIAMPGGAGTLEEITEVISWSRIGQNDKPCILFNVNGYYDPLKSMYDQMVEKGFLTAEDRGKILFSEDLDEISNFIESYEPPKAREY